jgi:hypothetical protein
LKQGGVFGWRLKPAKGRFLQHVTRADTSDTFVASLWKQLVNIREAQQHIMIVFLILVGSVATPV